MRLFTAILLFALIGLAFAQFNDMDLDRFFERFKNGEELFRRFREDEDFSNPFPRRNFGNRQRQSLDKKQQSAPVLDKSKCRCRIATSARIVGGKTAIPNSIPWQVSLASHGLHFCGGTIINSRYVLSAQHCTEGKSPYQIKVRVGLHRLSDANQRNTYSVKKIHKNDFNGDVMSPGDIVILELDRDIEFKKEKVEPACLGVTAKSLYPGNLVASGWGTTSVSLQDRSGRLRTGNLSPVLKKAYLFQDRKYCKSFLICVDSHNGDSVCQGDSGGPLHYTSNGKTTVEGVASFVTGTASFGAQVVELCTGSGAYSRNSFYKEWIESIVGKNYCA